MVVYVCGGVGVCCAAADAAADGVTLVSIGVGSAVTSAWLSSIGQFYYISDFSLFLSLVGTITTAAYADIDVGVDCASSQAADVGGVVSTRLDITNGGIFNYSNPLPFSVIIDAAGLQGLAVQPSADLHQVCTQPCVSHATVCISRSLACCVLSCSSLGSVHASVAPAPKPKQLAAFGVRMCCY